MTDTSVRSGDHIREASPVALVAIAVTAFTSPLVALTVVIGPVIELPLLVLMVRGLLALRPRGWLSTSTPP